MNKSNIFLFFLFFSWNVFTPTCLASSNELYPFNNEQDRKQFQDLLQELRCLVCQNQSLAESNAPLAKDMRQLIYRQLEAGRSEESIESYLIDRYSGYILLKPKFNRASYLLWLGPFVLCLFLFYRLFFRNL